MHTQSLASVFPGIYRRQTVDLWNSGSTGPAAPSTPLQGWVLLSHVLRPAPMSLSAQCHLQIVTVAPAATKPIFPADLKLSTSLCLVPRAQVWLEVVSSACSVLLPLLSPSLASLSPGPSCTVVELLCFTPESRAALISVFQQLPGCPCPSCPHMSGHTHMYTHVQAALHLPVGHSGHGQGNLCIKTHVHMFSFPDTFWKI